MVELERQCKTLGKGLRGPGYKPPQENSQEIKQKIAMIQKNAKKMQSLSSNKKSAVVAAAQKTSSPGEDKKGVVDKEGASKKEAGCTQQTDENVQQVKTPLAKGGMKDIQKEIGGQAKVTTKAELKKSHEETACVQLDNVLEKTVPPTNVPMANVQKAKVRMANVQKAKVRMANVYWQISMANVRKTSVPEAQEGG